MVEARNSGLLRRFETAVGWVASAGGLIGGLGLAMLLVDRNLALALMLSALAVVNAALLLGLVYGTTWVAVSAGTAVHNSVKEVQDVRRREARPEAGQLAFSASDDEGHLAFPLGDEGGVSVTELGMAELAIAEPQAEKGSNSSMSSPRPGPTETKDTSAPISEAMRST